MSPEILDEAEFENAIREMSDRQLSEFTARRIFAVCEMCATHSAQIKELEQINRKTFGVVGGIAGFLGTLIGAIILYLYQKLRG